MTQGCQLKKNSQKLYIDIPLTLLRITAGIENSQEYYGKEKKQEPQSFRRRSSVVPANAGKVEINKGRSRRQ